MSVASKTGEGRHSPARSNSQTSTNASRNTPAAAHVQGGAFVPLTEGHFIPLTDVERITPTEGGSWVWPRDSFTGFHCPLSPAEINSATQPAIPAAPGWIRVRAELDSTGLFIETERRPILGWRASGAPIVAGDPNGRWSRTTPLLGTVAPDGTVYASDGWSFPDVADWLIGIEDLV